MMIDLPQDELKFLHKLLRQAEMHYQSVLEYVKDDPKVNEEIILLNKLMKEAKVLSRDEFLESKGLL